MVNETEKHHNSESHHDKVGLMKRWFKEVWNDHCTERIDELMSSNFVGHYEHEEISGINHWKEMIYDVLLKAIPYFHIEVKDIIADRDMVVSRWQAKGVLSEELFGVSPSNEEFEFSGISWARIVDCKIVENWNNWNMSYLFRQLLSEVKTLRGILPLCSFCKKVRDDKGYWEQVDVYIHKYSEADVSHSVCPECMKKNYPEVYASILSDKVKE